MDSMRVIDRLDSLIDELVSESDINSSSLASMLIAARDSVRDGYHVSLARRVWDASNALRDHQQKNSMTKLDPTVRSEIGFHPR